MRSLTDGLEEKTSQGAAPKEEGGWRDTVNTALSGVAGKVLLALVAVGILVFLVMRFQAAVGPPEETVAPNSVRVLNPLTGDLRWYEIRIGGTLDAGYYTVEYCWNDHGGDGVPVILNAHLYPVGDPRRDEPSMCPCCGARVVGHNPKPEEYLGQTPRDYTTGRADPCVVEHYTALLGG